VERVLVMLTATAIFVATYAFLAVGEIPGLRIDRTGAALIGAGLMIAFGVVSLPEAYRAVDFDTILLLLSMMILVAYIRLSGFFELVSKWVAEHARTRTGLLIAIVLLTGFFSAFLVNDAICLVLTPLVVEIVKSAKLNPLPYLLGVAMASNVGSVATITGNPQNILIGSLSQISYGSFAKALSPPALAGLVLTIAFIILGFRSEFRGSRSFEMSLRHVHVHWGMVAKAAVITLTMVILFFAGTQPAKVAFVASSLLLLTRRIKPEKIYREIDWSLLLLFAGLFVVVAAFERSVVSADVLNRIEAFHLERVSVMSTVAGVLSNIVSNVPAVLLLKPFVVHLPNARQAWLTLAMASTFAGNFTIVGSVANLIVVEKARRQGVRIGFWSYFRVGAPLTIATILIGALSLRSDW
jgi:Na+/H+ antiporter NhaD/arsenite permease-like protein